MAERKQRLINLHGSNIANLTSDKLVQGEIAVVHSGAGATLATLNGASALTYFLDSTATQEKINVVDERVKVLSGASSAMAEEVKTIKGNLSDLTTKVGSVSGDVETLKTVVGVGLSAYSTLCDGVNKLDERVDVLEVSAITGLNINGVNFTAANSAHTFDSDDFAYGDTTVSGAISSLGTRMDTAEGDIDKLETLTGKAFSGMSTEEDGFVKKYIDEQVATTYRYKGSKTLAEVKLLTPADTKTGDVYNLTTSGVIETSISVEAKDVPVKEGDNVAAVVEDGNVKWDKLASVIDLDNYYTKEQVDGKFTDLIDSASTNGNTLGKLEKRVLANESNISALTENKISTIGATGHGFAVAAVSGTAASAKTIHVELSMGKVSSATPVEGVADAKEVREVIDAKVGAESARTDSEIASAVEHLICGATTYKTLKNVEDYIVEHEGKYATLSGRVDDVQAKLTTYSGKVDTIENEYVSALTVNGIDATKSGKGLSVTVDAKDIAMTAYTQQTGDSAVTSSDKVDAAIAKVEAKANDARARMSTAESDIDNLEKNKVDEVAISGLSGATCTSGITGIVKTYTIDYSNMIIDCGTFE